MFLFAHYIRAVEMWKIKTRAPLSQQPNNRTPRTSNKTD